MVIARCSNNVGGRLRWLVWWLRCWRWRWLVGVATLSLMLVVVVRCGGVLLWWWSSLRVAVHGGGGGGRHRRHLWAPAAAGVVAVVVVCGHLQLHVLSPLPSLSVGTCSCRC